MSELWYRKLGFYQNPFSIKPAEYSREIVAYDMNYIHDKIENAEMLFVEGVYGTGKTSILKHIISYFRGRNRIIYFNFNKGEDFDVDALVEGANSFWRKLTGLQVKNLIMLLDEVELLKSREAQQLLDYHREGIIQSVVVVSPNYDKVKLPDEFNKMLNGNVLRTVELTNNEAIEMIRGRIGRIPIISNSLIIKLFKRADKNPRKLLEYCEDVCRFAVEIGDTEVTEFHINEVLGKEVILKKTKPQPKEKPEIIKDEVETVKDIVVEDVVEDVDESKPEIGPEPQIKDVDEPVIEVKSVEEAEPINHEEPKRKFKVNKLVVDSKNNPLGTITEKDNDDEIPEYKLYFLNE